MQIVDNGKGMSDTDARMCFERHATSKISSADDLFRLTTKGFRGEALASIAAVAQVELKTKLHDAQLGTLIEIDDSTVRKQEPCQTANGTSIAVKNLFFNVPARRNFLKEDSTELRHIIEEFERIVLAHPEQSFKLISNNAEVFNLPASNRIQRILGVFGNTFKDKLVHIDETTPAVKISGYVGRPDAAKKRGAEQYFFVNNRYFKHPYLHHAVSKAYEHLIPEDQRPSYFIFLEVPANKIDVNVHPTKTEIKFEEDKVIYALLHSAVKRSLGKNNFGPSLDFESESSFEITVPAQNKVYYEPSITVNPHFNPFETQTAKSTSSGSPYQGGQRKAGIQQNNWQDLYEIYKHEVNSEDDSKLNEKSNVLFDAQKIATEELIQLDNKYILCKTIQGLMIVDQQRAHEKILFEHYLNIIKEKQTSAQRLLFPVSLELSVKDLSLIQDLKQDLETLGFEIDSLGGQTVAINAVPAELTEYDPKQVLEGVLENYKLNTLESEKNSISVLALSLAKESSIRSGRSLSLEEMGQIIHEWIKLPSNKYTEQGKLIYHLLPLDEIEVLFRKRK
jgi:DNA mismatch repair protein MutL